MLDAHQTQIMFADLDPLQQEKAVRSYEIYSDITHTLSDEVTSKIQSFFSKASCPPCGCIVDGFKKMTGRMKFKIN